MGAPEIKHVFWYYNWGNVASVVGLAMSIIGIGFTIWTLRTAKSAEKAAIEAKNNAASLSFSNDARKAERHTKDVVLHMQSANFGQAAFRSSDLLELVNEMYERWPKSAATDLRAVLLTTKTDCEQNDKLIRKANLDPETPSTKDVERVIRKANSIHTSLVKIRVGTFPE